GFSKRSDIPYFLRTICHVDYVHMPLLAPTQDMLDRYRKEKGAWTVYEEEFLNLLAQRQIEQSIPEVVMADGCLLCTEDTPDRCHRRLVAEYLRDQWGGVEIVHLV